MSGVYPPLESQVTESAPLLSQQEPVDNFPHDQRLEDRRFGRGIQELHKPHDGIQQVSIQRADIDGPHLRMISRRGVPGLHQDRTDEGGGEFQAQSEVWLLRRGFENLANSGQLNRGEQIMGGIVAVATVAQQDLLAALGNHADRWLEHAVKRLQRHGTAGQVQPRERLDGPIFAHGPRDPLHQFLAVGSQPLGLAFGLLVMHHIHYPIHRNLFTSFTLSFICKICRIRQAFSTIILPPCAKAHL